MIVSLISKSKILTQFTAYKRRHPLFVNMCSAAVAWSLGDALCQYTENYARGAQSPFDWKRNIVVAAYATLIMTPIANVWYEGRFNGGIALLERVSFLRTRIQPLRLTQSWKFSLIQSGMTFTFCAPLFGTSYIFAHEIFLGDGDPIQEWRRKIFHILSCDISFWLVADFLNFYAIPRNYRVFFMLFADVLWSFILSALNNNFTEVQDLYNIFNFNDEQNLFFDTLDEKKIITFTQLQTLTSNYEKLYPQWVVEHGSCNLEAVFADLSKDSNGISLRNLLQFLRTQSDPQYMILKLALADCEKIGNVQMFEMACNTRLSAEELAKFRIHNFTGDESPRDCTLQGGETRKNSQLTKPDIRTFTKIAKSMQP